MTINNIILIHYKNNTDYNLYKTLNFNNKNI